MDRRLLAFSLLLTPLLLWSFIGAHSQFTWILETAPVLLGLPIAWLCRNTFPLSSLLLTLLWVHSVILIVGGHYTYALVPLGEWAKAWFGWTRNNYDKLGHFAQGFIPAVLVREILLRTSPLGRHSASRPSRWLPVLCVCVCLAFSAFYELIEWATAVLTGSAADDFLGTQGDPWDTQTDMLLALVGATLAMLLMPLLHDRSLAKLAARNPLRRS